MRRASPRRVDLGAGHVARDLSPRPPLNRRAARGRAAAPIGVAMAAYATQAEVDGHHPTFLFGPTALAQPTLEARAASVGGEVPEVRLKIRGDPPGSFRSYSDPTAKRILDDNPFVRGGAVTFRAPMGGMSQSHFVELAKGTVPGCPPSIAAAPIAAHLNLHHTVTRFQAGSTHTRPTDVECGRMHTTNAGLGDGPRPRRGRRRRRRRAARRRRRAPRTAPCTPPHMHTPR